MMTKYFKYLCIPFVFLVSIVLYVFSRKKSTKLLRSSLEYLRNKEVKYETKDNIDNVDDAVDFLNGVLNDKTK